MLTEERYNRILSKLGNNNTVKLIDLTKAVGASESTVRRDLAALEKMGKLKRVHGGAVAVQSAMLFKEPDVEEKRNLRLEDKEKIAKYAAQTINKNDFVFIDAGTTTEKMIEYITEKQATYVTNGFMHAGILARRGFKVFLTGGEVKFSTQALVGVSCVETIKNYHFTKCFLGANGITEENGITTHNIDEASVKRAAAEKSYVTYVLADSSKFGVTTAVTFAEMSDTCIITDKLTDPKYKEITIVKEVSV